MASVEKNGQPSMEEILASIRRIVADDPSGVSPLIDLNRKTLDQGAPSTSGGVGADDSPDFELPSMFRPESRPDKRSARSGHVSKKLGANLKSAPIGRLTDAIRNVGPKVAAVGTSGQTTKHAASQNLQSQKRHAQVHQAVPGQSQERAPGKPQTIQTTAENGDAAFGSRPKLAQSLSSLETKGEATQGRGTNVMATSYSNEVGSAAPATTNGHVATLKKTNGALSHVGAEHRGAQETSNSVQVRDTGNNDTVRSASATTRSQPQRDTPERASDAATPAQSLPQDTPRVMAPFRDTRMCMMGPASGATPADVAAPNTVGAEPTQQGGSDIGSIVPSALDLPGRGHQGSAEADTIGSSNATTQAAAQGGDVNGMAQSLAMSNDEDTLGNAGVNAHEADASPPPIPDEGGTGAPQQIEDATADLLRPMLRQWLSDNMPRMVEKALHIEVAETVRPRKPTDAS